MFNTLFGYLRRHHVALVALVFAMGGSAYAVAKVGTKNVKDESIRSIDVRDGALRGADVKDGSIKAKDLGDGAHPLSSGQVVYDGSGVLLEDANGFTDVQRTGVGTFVLSFAPSNPVCDVATAPTASWTNHTYPPVSITIEGGSGSTIRLVTANQDGEPVDLGPDFGYVGFSVIGTC